MAQGCTLLQDYLISHPQRLLELDTCQNPATLLPAGRTLARLGDIPNAVNLLRQALQQDPNLKFDPEQEAQQLANQGKAQRLVEEGQDLALDESIPTAVAKFQEALQLEPRLSLNPATEAQQWAARGKSDRLFWEGYNLAREGKLEPVVQKFRQVLQLNPDTALEPEQSARQFVAWGIIEQTSPLIRQGKITEAIALIQQAETLLPDERRDNRMTTNWNILCGGGSVWNQAETVMSICEKVVAADPDNGEYRDSRGLARAMTGDVEGAIADFQAFVEWTEEDDRKAQRQAWIKDLQAGKNPFTPKVLQTLREKEL